MVMVLTTTVIRKDYTAEDFVRFENGIMTLVKITITYSFTSFPGVL